MCLRKIVNDLLFTKTYPMISKSIFYISRVDILPHLK